MRTISVPEFKAKCLAILAEVERSGKPVTVTRRGRPIAQILPAVPRDPGPPQRRLIGSVTIVGDVIEPVLPKDAWEAERREQ